MEKPARHLLPGADFGKGPEFRGIEIDGESLFLRAHRGQRIRVRDSGLIHSHFCVFTSHHFSRRAVAASMGVG